MPVTNFPNGVSSFGNTVYGAGGLEGYPGGNVFHIDGSRGSDSGSGDGRSWDKAWETLEYGFDRVDNAMGGAERSTIFCRGSFDEDLTKLASKSDIIGCGSKSQRPMPRLRGTHIITDEYNGTRLINFYNECETAAYNWTFAGGGFEIHNCIFRAGYNDGDEVLGALSITDPNDVKIYNNQFLPQLELDYQTAAIHIPSIAGTHVYNCQIKGNEIFGVKGIYIATPSGFSFRHCTIEGNNIITSTQTVDDDSDEFFVIDNILIHRGAVTALFAEAVDINLFLAARNHLAATDINTVYPVLDSAH